jgi:hypothetical protein
MGALPFEKVDLNELRHPVAERPPVESLPFEKVSLDDLRSTSIEAPRPSELAGPEQARRQPDDARPEASDAVMRWLARLPANLRPFVLTRQYPHIASRLAESWRQPEQCEAYLKSLIMLDRPARQGFAFDAAAELNRLLDYYTSVLHPRPHSIWNYTREVPDAKE